MPRLKQIASSTFDLPEPFGPEIAVKHASRSVSTVRLPCDLKPSRMISMSRMPACAIEGVSVGRGEERAVRRRLYQPQSNGGAKRRRESRPQISSCENLQPIFDAPRCKR